jgi:hypothetical protein
MKNVFLTIALISTSALIAYPLFAHCGHCAADGKQIVEMLDQGKMTIAKAVTSAEQRSKGRAISVISELDDDHKLVMEVYCIVSDASSASAQPKIMKCQIDGTSGSVSEMKEVKAFPITDDDAAGGAHEGHGEKKPAGSAMNITNKTVDAACGVCIYKMQGQVGCPLAVKIDGKPYIVEGANWPNHDYCDRNCQAVVTGRIEGDKFIATKLEVKQ